MKIVVTGAAGFIGSHLAEKLCRQDHEVVGLDNFNDYYDPRRKRANEARLNQYRNFKMVEGDIRDREMLFELFRRERFDAVAHLAALAGVRNAVKYPDLYIEVDLNGTQHLMDAARATEVGNFVFASTSSVYGRTEQIPFVETDPCARPLQPYAAAKRASEILGHTYHYLYGLNFTAVRFFNAYGPQCRPDLMAFLLAESITTGREIPLYNNGEMYRDWTYIDDTTDSVVAALERPLGYEIINLGRGEPVYLKDFITIMEKLAGKKANLKPQPMMAADMPRTYADTTKARELLGHNPKVSIEEGIARFWEWYVTHELA